MFVGLVGAGQLACLGLGVLGAHQRPADQHRVDADPLELLQLGPLGDAALGDEIGRASCRERVSDTV